MSYQVLLQAYEAALSAEPESGSVGGLFVRELINAGFLSGQREYFAPSCDPSTGRVAFNGDYPAQPQYPQLAAALCAIFGGDEELNYALAREILKADRDGALALLHARILRAMEEASPLKPREYVTHL